MPKRGPALRPMSLGRTKCSRVFFKPWESSIGDNFALEELRKARQAALRGDDPADDRYSTQLRLGRDQVRLDLRLSRFEEAGFLADSLLSAPLPKSDQAVRDGWIV